MSNDNVVAIIPARGGSKGIPRKNLVPIGGYPLLAWSVRQALNCDKIQSVWVTSDSEEILEVARIYGSNCIKRPSNFAVDSSSSEEAWLHAVDFLESKGINPRLIVGMQPTSPIREPSDLSDAITHLLDNRLDSLLSVSPVDDYFAWEMSGAITARSINYDYRNRQRRQEIKETFIENGSFYVFKTSVLKEFQNRLGGRIGVFKMPRHKMFQIDEFEDINLCEAIIKGFNYEIG